MVELAQSQGPRAAEIVHHRTQPFPRAVRTFTGRQKELARALALLDTEVLFLVYGVSGIGKSEFVYKLIEQARASPPWDGAQLVLVTVGENHRAEHLTAFLRLHTGLLRAHDTALDGGLLASRTPSLQDDLAEIVAALNARPFLVFIDDLHNLDTTTAARVLSYLSRHVQRSRIFVASRLEIPLPNSPLKSLNSYVVTGADRNLVVDTGLNRPECLKAMQDGLAELAHLSPFHWHRVWHAMYGETLADTVRRLRLQRGSGLLAHTDLAVAEVARRCGYPNAQTFSRAFRDRYGQLPTAYRRSGSHVRFDRSAPPDAAADACDRSVRVLDVPAWRLAGVDHRGSYMDIGKAFETAFACMHAAGRIDAGTQFLAVYFDDPFAVPAARSTPAIRKRVSEGIEQTASRSGRR